MKILQICHRIPYPATDGGNIAMMNMALALIESGHEVHQFALNTKKHFVDIHSIPLELQKMLHFHSVMIDTKIRLTGALNNFFTSDSYNIVRFFSAEAEDELKLILQNNNFDIIQLETLYTTLYINCIKENSSAKIILRAHNAEHIIWERLAKSESNIVKKYYLNFLTRRLKAYEIKVLKYIDAILPISDVDENIFKGLNYSKPILTIPISLNFKEYTFDENEKTEMCLFHLGSMDWMPNIDAIKWFLEKCWKQINTLFPDLKLYLAGRSFPQEIIDANYPNVICEGKIADAHLYMRKKQIMIVPLHSGSGIRVKIIQGMALGKTIISTTTGAEGIPIENEKNILLANTPEEFITIIGKCVQNQEMCKQIGKNGRNFAESNYSNTAIGKKLDNFYKSLIVNKSFLQ